MDSKIQRGARVNIQFYYEKTAKVGTQLVKLPADYQLVKLPTMII